MKHPSTMPSFGAFLAAVLLPPRPIASRIERNPAPPDFEPEQEDEPEDYDTLTAEQAYEENVINPTLEHIRLVVQDGSTTMLGGDGGPVEIDETFIGAKARNMHKSRKLRLTRARNEISDCNATQSARYWGKTIVMGMLERGGKVKASVIPERKSKVVQQIVRESVTPGCEIMTDEFTGYVGLSSDYTHQVINHLEGYVREHVSTNGMENFWSLLKRSLGGTYVAVEPFHLFRYVDEQAFRFNNRKDANGNKMSDAQRFSAALSQVAGKRLTFAEVTGKVGERAF